MYTIICVDHATGESEVHGRIAEPDVQAVVGAARFIGREAFQDPSGAWHVRYETHTTVYLPNPRL